MSAWCPCNTYTCKYKCIFNILMNNYGNVLKMTQSLYKNMYYIYYHYSAYCIYRICFDCNLAFHHDKPWTCCLKLCYLHVHKTFSIWLWYERLKLKSSMSLWLTCSLNTIELSTCNGVLKHQYLEFPKQLEVLVSSIHL